MSETEREQRIHLAACYRLLAHYGVEDLTYNHLSVRVLDEPDTLLIKQGTEMFGEVTASSLRKYRFDGTPMHDGPRLIGGSLVIHAGILQARPDINAVFHTHTPANMGVASQKHGLLMINQHAVKFYKRLAYHDFGGYEFNMSQRAPLIASLGPHRVALLRNHGALVCGRTVQEALVDHNYLEMACRGQIAALAGGSEVHLIPDDIAAFGASQINFEDPAQSGAKDWAACLRLAYRLDPGFAD
ncbi:MAG: class II aldolase/adducin family protein [Pigmentiphaga sp.]|uniref:class II aldolase/adducin family protein n=1 Tax=Pigmentiphaga sp. TaxID=1977564 RepID=UPI0029B556CD|nr:class II aldolase/adducin family protein [Pigmentiphaga sp.]MDX3908036.1 class II aldolase/adducin family protein [Pigmentiphaga sp.]